MTTMLDNAPPQMIIHLQSLYQEFLEEKASFEKLGTHRGERIMRFQSEVS